MAETKRTIPTITVLGSLNIDLVSYVSHHPLPGETMTSSRFAVSPGGKGANQAVACAKLSRSSRAGAGGNAEDRSADPEATARVRMVGAVGGAGDGYGDLLATNLRRQGVDASRVLRPDGLKTGIAIIVVDEPTGGNRIILSPEANHHLRPSHLSSATSPPAGLLTAPALRPDLLIMQLEIPQDTLNRIVMRRLEHVYFKPAQVVKILEENAWKSVPAASESVITPRSDVSDATGLVNILCRYLFENSEGIIRARAMLCQIYFLALHDEYYQARDMMLMSHLQETINSFDVQTQILYNRTLVQVGLCAFRKGLVYDAQNTLQEICGSGRQKELLAQGVMIQRYSQVSPEQERLEKQRQLPFHMHINLELLECVYLTCSMLLEIPLLAQTGSSPDIKKRVISKTYRRMLEYHERQIFTGPPENTRDHVMQASRALAAGEWKKATNFVHSIKIWDLMPDTEGIKTMLSKQIQEEGLRTYLFTYAPYYDTLAVSTLSSMFELEDRKVAALVSKMISHEELAAALDQVTATVIFRKGVELSRLQSLALTLSDKAAQLIETNERTLEHRTQGTANAFDRRGGQNARGGRGGGQRGGGRGGRGGGIPRQAGGTQFTGGALGAAVRG